METIGSRLREERVRLAMNQTEFAAISGHKKHSQIRYEAGERSPDGDYFAAIGRHGVDVLYVLIGVRASPVQSEADEASSSDKERLRLAIEAVEEGLDALDREATADVRAGLIFAAYEVLEEHGEKATAQIIRLVKAA